jgi:hypothetical protein
MQTTKRKPQLPALIKYLAICQRDGITISVAKRSFRAAGGRMSNRRFFEHWQTAERMHEAFSMKGLKRRG